MAGGVVGKVRPPPPPEKFKLSNFQILKHVVKLMNKNLWQWAPLTNKIIFRIPQGVKIWIRAS